MIKTKYILTTISCGLLVLASAESIKVEKQTPIIKSFTKKIKVCKECYEQTIEEIVNCRRNNNTNSVGLDTIIGGVLGVAVGSQIGRGNGSDVAKVVGGITGMHLANQDRNNQKCKSYREVTKCDPVYEYKTKEATIGYRNCATYMDQKVCKETARPQDYLEITHKIYVD